MLEISGSSRRVAVTGFNARTKYHEPMRTSSNNTLEVTSRGRCSERQIWTCCTSLCHFERALKTARRHPRGQPAISNSWSTKKSILISTTRTPAKSGRNNCNSTVRHAYQSRTPGSRKRKDNGLWSETRACCRWNSQTDEFELRNRHSKFAAVRQFACKFGYIVYIYVLSYICKFKCSSAIYIIV